MQVNRYLIDADPERRDARRLELKRALAQRTLNQERITELRSIVDRLDRDSDDAAEQHSIATSKLQAELDKLDAQHVDAILDGKSSSAKSLQRRSEILNELAELNKQLETRCEANKRSKQPYEKQIHELRNEVAKAATLESELLELGGAKYRVRQAIDELTIRGAEFLLNEAKRRQSVHAINYQNDKDWDDAQRRGNPSESTIINKAKLDDWTSVVEHFQSRLDEALQASKEQLRLAVAS